MIEFVGYILQNTMQIWIFKMMKNLLYIFLILTVMTLGACSGGKGQVIYNWEKEDTGVAKFSRDHSECMRKAEPWYYWPDVASWFYSEEYRYDIRVDWHQEKGIWASYVPYRGASPLLVNSIRNSARADPKTYRLCMEKRGYWHRRYDIPTVTNIFVYHPQLPSDTIPFADYNYY